MFFNQDDVDRYVADYGSTSLATSSVSMQAANRNG